MKVKPEERTAILASLVNTRSRYSEAQRLEDQIIDALNQALDNVDLIEVSFDESHECESSGDTLSQVITCYLNYGEGDVEKIVDLIVEKLEEC